MKKSIILFAIFFLGILSVKAQSDYKAAIGLRVGVPVSASLKYFITKQGALEAYAGFWHDGVSYGFNYFRLGGMYQHHFPIGDVEGLKWYVGGGAFVQFYSYDQGFRYNNYSSTGLAINAVGGVDYKFKTIPLNVSADWMPTIFFGRTYYSTFGGAYGGISARYTFK